MQLISPVTMGQELPLRDAIWESSSSLSWLRTTIIQGALGTQEA